MNGSDTRNVVPARSRLERQRAVVTVDDDPAGRRQPEPGSPSHVLGREEGVEDPRLDLRRHPGAVVRDLDERVPGHVAGGDRDRPVIAERIDRVVEQVRPHLVELGSAHGQPGKRPVVVALDLDRRLPQLVSEDHDRRLDPLVKVDLDEVAAVHVRVRLDRADEARHASRRLLELVGQALCGEGRGDPAERGVGGRPGGRGDTVDPVLVEAGGDQRLDELPRLRHPELLEPRQQLVLGVGRIERAERGLTLGARDRLPVQRDECLGVAALDARLHEPAHRRAHDLERLGHLRRGAARRRRRVVQLVGQPGGHRAERGQPLAVLLEAGDPAHHGRDLLHHAPVHRGVREREAAEVLGRDQARGRTPTRW